VNRRILERRLDCLDYSFSGLRCSEWIPIIAGRYGVSESALWSDWSRRDAWLPQIIQLDKSAFKMSELIGRMERAATKAYSTMLATSNENVRIGAARIVGSLSKTMFDIGSQAGIYPSVMKSLLEKLVMLEEELK